MWNSIYFWLAILITNSMFLGTAIERVKQRGSFDMFDIGMSALIVLSSAIVICCMWLEHERTSAGKE